MGSSGEHTHTTTVNNSEPASSQCLHQAPSPRSPCVRARSQAQCQHRHAEHQHHRSWHSLRFTILIKSCDYMRLSPCACDSRAISTPTRMNSRKHVLRHAHSATPVHKAPHELSSHPNRSESYATRTNATTRPGHSSDASHPEHAQNLKPDDHADNAQLF